jgi:hypothetical protein
VKFRKTWPEPFSELALNVTGGDGGCNGKGKGGGKSGRPGTVEFALERCFENELLEGEASGYEARAARACSAPSVTRIWA